MVVHHPTPELLTAFSAGSLSMSHALGVGVHVECCSSCQINVQRLNNLGAQFFENMQPAVVTDNLRDSVFAQLDDIDPVPEAEYATPLSTTQSMPTIRSRPAVPRSLKQFIPNSYNDLKWSRVTSSIETAPLCTDKANGAKIEMLRIRPGGNIATHTHTGDEYTVVLEGGFSDESGIYLSGDFVVRDGQHKHRPMATKDSHCICLAITDAPIAFTGTFTRWLNPLLKRSYTG